MLLFGHIHVICHVFSNEGISKRGLHREIPPPPPHNGRTVAPEAILFESPCRAHPET